MTKAVLIIIIAQTAWTGQSTRTVEFNSMDECYEALDHMKIEQNNHRSVVAYCEPKP